MKVGDLVRRKKPIQVTYGSLHTSDGCGIILAVGWSAHVPHRCITVFWFDRKGAYEIAESLIKVIE